MLSVGPDKAGGPEAERSSTRPLLQTAHWHSDPFSSAVHHSHTPVSSRAANPRQRRQGSSA